VILHALARLSAMSQEPEIPYSERPYTVLLGFEEEPGPSIYLKHVHRLRRRSCTGPCIGFAPPGAFRCM
jgi:hypothetical protein